MPKPKNTYSNYLRIMKRIRDVIDDRLNNKGQNKSIDNRQLSLLTTNQGEPQ